MSKKLNVLESVHSIINDFDGEISLNELLILYAIQSEDKELFLDIKDRCKSDYYFKESIEWLLRKGFMENKNPDKFVISFQNLELNNQIIESLNNINLIDINVTEAKSDSKVISNFVNVWYELWPVGVRPNGYLVRSGKKPVEKKLLKFIKEYPEFSEETILEATAQYVKRYALKGYAFMKTASYFIYKDGESVLAGECEKFIATPRREIDDTKSTADESRLL